MTKKDETSEKWAEEQICTVGSLVLEVLWFFHNKSHLSNNLKLNFFIFEIFV